MNAPSPPISVGESKTSPSDMKLKYPGIPAMNPNENHVSPLAHQIDELIETGQPTGIPAADDLATTIPQARPDFQKQLEERLTAQIQFAAQGDEKLAAQT